MEGPVTTGGARKGSPKTKVVQRTAEKKKKKTIFVVANLFIFIFRDVKRTTASHCMLAG